MHNGNSTGSLGNPESDVPPQVSENPLVKLPPADCGFVLRFVLLFGILFTDVPHCERPEQLKYSILGVSHDGCGKDIYSRYCTYASPKYRTITMEHNSVHRRPRVRVSSHSSLLLLTAGDVELSPDLPTFMA